MSGGHAAKFGKQPGRGPGKGVTAMSILNYLRRFRQSIQQGRLSRRSKPRRPQLQVENLEERSLLSVSLDTNAHVYHIDGDNTDDTYTVRVSNDMTGVDVLQGGTLAGHQSLSDFN